MAAPGRARLGTLLLALLLAAAAALTDGHGAAAPASEAALAEQPEASLIKPRPTTPDDGQFRNLPVIEAQFLIPGLSAPASAQEDVPAEEEPAAADAATTAAGAEVEALIAILRDEAARARLISELERLALQEDVSAADAERETETEATPAEAQLVEGTEDVPRLSVGRRIAEATQEAAQAIGETIIDFQSGLAATQRRLRGLANANGDRIAEIAGSIGLVLVIAVGLFWLLRLAVQPIYWWLGRRAEAMHYVGTSFLFIFSVIIDALVVVIAWASGYAAAFFALDPRGEVLIYQSLFLNAFLLVGSMRVLLRALLAPAERRLRPVPLDDRSARYWSRWGAVLLGILGYGLMLVVPIVNDAAGIFTGRATSVLIYVVVLGTSIVLVFLNRRSLPRWLRARAEERGGDFTLGLLAGLARFGWIAIIAYLLLLFVFAVTNSGQVAPVVVASLRVLGAMAVGAIISTLMAQLGDQGVRLPASISTRMPMLEERLNAFVPAFLRIVRFIIALAVIAFTLQTLGIADLWGWLDSSLGVDVASTLVSVLLILLFAFLFWLALASWVDYRLAPTSLRRPTQREQTLLSLLRNALTVVIVAITAMFSLSELGVDIAPLLASAGVLGLAIGFGAQKMVQDIITGIFIQFENAMNVGDVVTVGGISGVVEKLTIRSVSLRDLTGVYHIIPFSSVDLVSNFMKGFSYHVADFGIAYREDVDEAKALMLSCFSELKADPAIGPTVLGELEWFGVERLGDSAVILRARIKTLPGKQWDAGRKYNELLKKAADRTGLEIPFPHMTLWFGVDRQGKAPPAPIRLDNARDLVSARPEPKPVSGGTKPTMDAPYDTGDTD